MLTLTGAPENLAQPVQRSCGGMEPKARAIMAESREGEGSTHRKTSARRAKVQASDCTFRGLEGTDFLFFTKNLGVEYPDRTPCFSLPGVGLGNTFSQKRDKKQRVDRS